MGDTINKCGLKFFINMFRRCLRRKLTLHHLLFLILVCLFIYLFGFTSEKIEEADNLSDWSDPKSESEILDFRNKRYEWFKNRQVSNGPGEWGAAVRLSADEQKRADSLFRKEAFNIVASDKISLQRTLKDTRNSGCASLQYPDILPNASVIIIFHNEAWSPLLRTVHSVVNRSPPKYLHEVILLDDFSDRDGLGGQLDKYVSKTWPDGVVKIVRTAQRSGLIRARLAGAEAATGDVLVFLDSHCEANQGWLEPLLSRISEKRSAVVCPEIDVISAQTLAYSGVGGRSVGGFWWSLHFSWRPMPAREEKRRKSPTDPISTADWWWFRCFVLWSNPLSHIFFLFRSPTMAGGLFAVDRKYFFEVGAYDPGMDVWGGENLELSFRTWMCGGSLEFIPCSRIGHIFRASHPYTFPGNKDTHGLNSKRLAEVWMDDYKRLFYMHRRDLQAADAGNISERVSMRQRLGCHSFKWYLENIYPEKFIPDENVQAWGMVRNPTSSLCLDTLGKDEKTTFNIGLFHCQGGSSASEVFSLSLRSEIRREEGCLDTAGWEGGKVSLTSCHGQGLNQKWTHNKESGTIVHVRSGKCLDKVDILSGGEVVIRACTGSQSQQWTFQFYT